MTRQEQCRRAQSKYRRSAKGKAQQQRYRSSGLGKQIRDDGNARRIYVGYDYRGKAATRALARAINAHVRRRIECHLAETRAKSKN